MNNFGSPSMTLSEKERKKLYAEEDIAKLAILNKSNDTVAMK